MTTWQNHGQDSSQLCGDMPAVEWNAVLHELSVYVKPKEGALLSLTLFFSLTPHCD